ncbi:hypothetical protein WN48_07336 [Eufriesea mexicana]|nr:hypothetical protein WN48_07336 [Eufriesea mexicana]
MQTREQRISGQPVVNSSPHLGSAEICRFCCSAMSSVKLDPYTGLARDERHPLDPRGGSLEGGNWRAPPEKPHVRTVRMFSRLDKNESEWQVSQISLQFLVTHIHFVGNKLKIRCSASIYDIYWQTTEVSTEEDRPRVIHYEPPAATIVGINYLQPPPNFQTGQKKPAGHVGVKGDPVVEGRKRTARIEPMEVPRMLKEISLRVKERKAASDIEYHNSAETDVSDWSDRCSRRCYKSKCRIDDVWGTTRIVISERRRCEKTEGALKNLRRILEEKEKFERPESRGRCVKRYDKGSSQSGFVWLRARTKEKIKREGRGGEVSQKPLDPGDSRQSQSYGSLVAESRRHVVGLGPLESWVSIDLRWVWRDFGVITGLGFRMGVNESEN